MPHTLAEIADAIGAQAVGETSLIIARAAEPGDAGPDDLALAMSPKYAEDLPKGAARAAMLWPDADWQGMGLKGAILPARPRFAMAGMTRLIDPGQGFAHPFAHVPRSGWVFVPPVAAVWFELYGLNCIICTCR